MDNLDLFLNPLDEATVARHIKAVVSHTGKNEKLAWNRRVKKMQGLVDSHQEYEERILAIIKEKEPLLDEISILRNDMIKECIHPKDHIVHMNTYLVCRFCERKLSIPRIIDRVQAPVAETDTELADDGEE